MRGDKVIGLPPEHPTLASRLSAAGYRTALIGKWHLGFPPTFSPLTSGYDEHFGPLSGGVDYFTHQDSFGAHDLFENGSEVNRDGYLTDLLVRARRRVRRRVALQSKQPFLLSLHYTAPHWPWETRDDGELAKSFGKANPIYHLDGGNIHAYRRMIHHMDEGIGRVLAALDDKGLARDTIVVFTSDNGGERFSDNWPLVGGKMDLMEGGIRVPYVVRWPARTPAGATTDQLAITMDWVPTFFEAAGASAHPDYPSDGVSLVKHARRSARHRRPPAVLAHEAPRPARDACRPLEVPQGRRARIPVRRRRRRARARQPRQAPSRAAGRDARRLAAVGRDHAAHSGRRRRPPGLRQEGHAVAAMSDTAAIRDILDFWFLPLGDPGYGKTREIWWESTPELDAEITQPLRRADRQAVAGAARSLGASRPTARWR